MYVSGNSKVGVNRNSVGFYLKFHLVQGIVCGNAKDYGDICFREGTLEVVYRGDIHVGVRGMILSYISNR